MPIESSRPEATGASTTLTDKLAAIAHKAGVSTNSSGAAIALKDPQSGVFVCRARSGSHAPEVGSTMQREGTFTGLCVQTGETLCCDDTEEETRVDTQAARTLGIRSMLVTPVTQGSSVVGVLAVFSFTPQAFTLAHRKLLGSLAKEIAALIPESRLVASGILPDKALPAPEVPPTSDVVNASAAASSVQDVLVGMPANPAPGGVVPNKMLWPPEKPSAPDLTGGSALASNVQQAKMRIPADPVRPGAAVEPRPSTVVIAKRQDSRGILIASIASALIILCGFVFWRTGWLTPSAATPLPAIRLHGSNTLGSEYVPMLAKAYLEHIGATAIRVQPIQKEEILIGGITPKGSALELDIRSHGSWTGFKDLAADKADIAMASTRLPDPESLQGDSPDTTEKRAALAKLKGLKAAQTEFVVGLDGLAIISTKARPSLSLTHQQVCDVFAGKIANWQQLGSGYTPAPIRVYARDKNSGTRKTFVDLCFDGKDSLPASGPTVFEDSQQLSNSVANDANAIGFVGLPFAHSANPVTVDGRLPDESSVRLEEYAFTRRLYLYRHPHQLGEAELTGEFIEFALSPEGQRVVQQAGFVDQEVRLETPNAPHGAPRDYLALTAGAKRASLAIRFELNSSLVEGKSLRDIRRLKLLLEDNHALNENVLVFGFSDATGTPTVNCAIAKERALAAEEQLHKAGLPNTMVKAFGQLLPLTNDTGAEALAKNRRVEIWVTPTSPQYNGPSTCQ